MARYSPSWTKISSSCLRRNGSFSVVRLLRGYRGGDEQKPRGAFLGLVLRAATYRVVALLLHRLEHPAEFSPKVFRERIIVLRTMLDDQRLLERIGTRDLTSPVAPTRR
jgi:hypothetical protein